MDVVRHHHEGIQCNRRESPCQGSPDAVNSSPCRVQHHLAFPHFAKQTGPVIGAGGDEIGTGRSVVVAVEPKPLALWETLTIHPDCPSFCVRLSLLIA